MPSTTVAHNNANLVWGGHTPDQSNIGGAGIFARQLAGNGSQLIVRVTNSEQVTFQVYGNNRSVAVRVDEGSATNYTWAPGWQTFTVSGLEPSVAHEIRFEALNQAAAWFRQGNTIVATATVLVPTFELPSGWTTNVWTTEVATKNYIAHDDSMAVNTGDGNSNSLSGNDSFFRFRATGSGLGRIRIWTYLDGNKIRREIDGIEQDSNSILLPNTGRWGWYEVFSGIDTGAEHEYIVSFCGNKIGFLYGLWIEGAIGVTALPARDLYTFYGDSITAGTIATGNDQALSMAYLISQALHVGRKNLGIGGSTVKNAGGSGGSSGIARVSQIPVNSFLIVNLFGTNDMVIVGNTDDIFEDDYREMIDAQRVRCPDAVIYCLGILPRRGYDDPRVDYNGGMQRAITAKADAGITYLSTDGWIDPAVNNVDTIDGLHPNAAGYQKIKTEFLDATGSDVTPPAVPTGLAITVGAGSLTPHWNVVGDADVSDYRVYRSLDNVTYNMVQVIAHPAHTWTDTGRTPGTTYWYKVTARDDQGNESARSAGVSAIPDPLETVPPVVLNANVPAAGTTVIVNMTEATSPPVLPASGVTGFSVTVAGVNRSVTSASRTAATQFTLVLSSPVLVSQVVTLSYVPGNVTDSAVPPNAMAAASGIAVTNNSTQALDAIAPVFSTALIPAAGNTVVVNLIEASSPPVVPVSGVLGFFVVVDGVDVDIVSASRSGSTQITLALLVPVYVNQVVTVEYTQGNVADSQGNLMGSFHPQAVVNGSTQTPGGVLDTFGPVPSGGSVPSAGTTVLVDFVESQNPPLLPAAGITGFTVRADGVLRTVASAVRITSTRVQLTLSSPVYVGQIVTVGYVPGNLTDSATPANPTLAFTNFQVDNGSTTAAPITPPPSVVGYYDEIYEFLVDGEPTDPSYGPVLRDPTGTYGAIRNDTQAILLPVNEPYFLKLATGIFLFRIPDPGPGTTVTFWPYAEDVDGIPVNEQRDFSTGLTEVESVYPWEADLSDLEDEFGKENIRIWSNLTDTKAGKSTDLNRVSKAVGYARGEILKAHRGGTVDASLMPNDPTMRSWSARLAGIWLYRSRPGNQVKTKKSEEGPYEAMERDVYNDMGQVRVGYHRLGAVTA